MAKSELAVLGGEPLRTRPFPPWPAFDERERAQLEEVLASHNWGGYPSPNRKASEFAAKFSAFQGAQFAIPTSSGTTALEVSLKALGVGPGDEVIVPATTFYATAYVAVACGARPVFADVRAQDACIDADSVRRLISPRTRAIIPVHYGSAVADLDALGAIARERAIPIVEDCAHVPGAQWRGRGVGAHGSLGCFSFQSSKPMTAGEGGCILTSDRALEQRCQSLVNCGRRRPGDGFEEPLLGSNYRMTEWQCGVLIAQLARLPAQIAHQHEMAGRLRKGLSQITGLRPVAVDDRVTREVIYMFMFAVDAERLGVSRNRFVRAMIAEGIPCGLINEPVYRTALFPLDAPAYLAACEAAGAREKARDINCPVAERLFEREMASIRHDCLLGDERDVDDIIAAAEKVAASARELAGAKLDRAA
ncbi:MAG: DegT/DnrJ/EryC1/StrS family aminotransferase [Candidatus Binataceae bacterium]